MTADTAASSIAGRRQAATALMIATAMQAFDATIANVALPQLERGFSGGIDLGSWVMICGARIKRSAGGHRTRLTWANRRRRHGPPDAMPRRCHEFVKTARSTSN
jgi:hypothetical protein